MKKFILIEPRFNDDAEKELTDCLSQLDAILSSMNSCKDRIIKQTLFIAAEDFEHFLTLKNILSGLIDDYYGSQMPPFTFVPQPPVKSGVCLEILLSEGFTGVKRVSGEAYNYIIVDYPDRTELITGELCTDEPGASVTEQADCSMKKLEAVLAAESFAMSDIVRQWNYIGNICDYSIDNTNARQNYQVFNDARTWFYNKCSWNNGYPASTGIGAGLGRIIVDCIAVKMKNGTAALPLRNPRQADAHRYSGDVLLGKPSFSYNELTTPKFERGKAVITKHGTEIYVSGTAAILGEESLAGTNAAAQAEVTVENILELVSDSNLTLHAIGTTGHKPLFRYLRVYLKHTSDYQQVKEITDRYFPGIAAAWLKADICRKELLVEIEAYLSS